MTDSRRSTREAFIDALLEISKKNENIVTIAADSQSRYGEFPNLHKNRSFNVGIAEQSMVGIAAGLALSGKIPVVTAYANFLTFRAAEQIRVDIAGQNLNVKIVGTDAGFSSEWLGYTHVALEDVAAIRSMPNIVIIDPADYDETFAATKAMFDYNGPVYLRLRGKGKEPQVYEKMESYKIGKGNILRGGSNIAIICSGGAVYDSLSAANILKGENIEATVIDMASIRPLDKELILDLALKVNLIVTVEDHNVIGGLGSAVAELISENCNNVKLLRLGVKDRFGTAGTEELLKKNFMLDDVGIAYNISEFLKNK